MSFFTKKFIRKLQNGIKITAANLVVGDTIQLSRSGEVLVITAIKKSGNPSNLIFSFGGRDGIIPANTKYILKEGVYIPENRLINKSNTKSYETRAKKEHDDFNSKGFNMKGIHKNGTLFDERGFDAGGFDRKGFDNEGFDIRGFNQEEKHRNGTIFDNDGFASDGFNRYGLNREGYNRGGYNEEGYSRQGFNKEGYDRNGYNSEGFDLNGYDREGYDREGFDINGYDRKGYDRECFDPLGYNINGFDVSGFDKEGYDHLGFNIEGYDREGFLKSGYNNEGYDRNGLDREGYDREVYNLNKEGYDRQGYNIDGDFRPFIQSYLKKNKVLHKNKAFVYSDRLKNILWELNEVEKLLGYKLFDSAARTLRAGSELFTKELCEQSSIRRGFTDQFQRLHYLRDNKIIDSQAYEQLNQARLQGNMSNHLDKSERKIEEDTLKELYLGVKAIVHKWISGLT
jgi:hypothetical protein